jgi:hypothetical protein
MRGPTDTKPRTDFAERAYLTANLERFAKQCDVPLAAVRVYELREIGKGVRADEDER